LPVNLSCTGGGALLYAVQNAGPKEPAFWVVLADLELTGAKPEDFLQYYQDLPEVLRPGEWAEQPAASWAGFAGDINAGKIVARGDFQVRERFIIDEVGVVRGVDVLD